jgi:hypothetical protein
VVAFVTSFTRSSWCFFYQELLLLFLLGALGPSFTRSLWSFLYQQLLVLLLLKGALCEVAFATSKVLSLLYVGTPRGLF